MKKIKKISRNLIDALDIINEDFDKINFEMLNFEYTKEQRDIVKRDMERIKNFIKYEFCNLINTY